MAGDWIKFDTATPDKPEVWAIAEAAGIDPDAVVGKLLRVWIWFDQHTEDGTNAPSVSKKVINRLVGVSDFCEHVISCGWMHEKNGKISLPHFDRHNGKTAKNRALTAKRVAKHSANAKLTPTALPKEEKRRYIPPKSPAQRGTSGGQKSAKSPPETKKLNGKERAQITNCRGPDQLANILRRIGVGLPPPGMTFEESKVWAIRKIEVA